MNSKKQTVSHSLKQLSYSQLSRSWPQEQQYLLRNLYQKQKRFRRRIRLNSYSRGYKPTSLTAAVSPQQNRALEHYGKSPYCIPFHKTGKDLTSRKSLPKILGVQITGIVAPKAPLSPERFLKVCPMYFIPSAQTAKKVEMEKRKMFVPGNSFSKTMVAAVFLFVFIDMSYAIKNKLEKQITFWNKKYETVQAYEEAKNGEAVDEAR